MHKAWGFVGVFCAGLFSAVTAFGEEWTTVLHSENSAAPSFWGAAAGPAGVIAVGTQGTVVQSMDGWNWRPQNSGSALWLLSVAYGNGHYVIVGDQGLILTSQDGEKWAQVGGGLTHQRLNRILFADHQFVAVGEGETILTSLDGQSWKLAMTDGPHWLRGLAYSTYNFWIAAGQAGTNYYSTDGLIWVKGTPIGASDIEALKSTGDSTFGQKGGNYIWGTLNFLAIGARGSITNVSADYSSFLGGPTTIGAPQLSVGTPLLQVGVAELRAVGYESVSGRDFVFGSGGTILARGPVVLSSNWAPVPSITSVDINDCVEYARSIFVVGAASTILRTKPPEAAAFANISTRGYVRTGEQVLIAGTVITGTTPIKLLIRALGKTLQDYGVQNVLPDPQIEAYDGSNKLIATVGAWAESTYAHDVVDAMASLGATSLDPSKKDAALVLTLPPGGYTFIVKSTTAKEGVALIDLFDLSAPVSTQQSHLLNVSTRGYVGPGEQSLIAGLIVTGNPGGLTKPVLLRALGPRLAPYGVAQPLANPRLTIHRSDGTIEGQNDDWGTNLNLPWVTYVPKTTKEDFANLMKANGLSSLEGFEKDSASVFYLRPGAYTIQVSSEDGGTGTALVEAYEIPN